MKEEDNVLKKVGKENNFRVPDGYFENLTSEVMNRLPEKEKAVFAKRESTTWERVRPWLYMAGMFVGAALIIRVASADRTPAVDQLAVSDVETELVSDEYISEVLDNSMLEDYSLYVYLTDASAD